MATDLGKVGIVMKGTWSSSSAYEVLDAVSYSGGLYIAKRAVPANTLPTNTTYWQSAVTPGYPKTQVVVTAAEGFTVDYNASYRIGDVVYLTLLISTTTAVTARTICCTISDFARPASATRFACAAATTHNSALNAVSTGFIKTNGEIAVGDNSPGAKDFAISTCYVV